MTEKRIPLLNWVGKKQGVVIDASRVRLIERFDHSGSRAPISSPDFAAWSSGNQNLLFQGDNMKVLQFLISSGFGGRVKLIYIDPPFDSGSNYVRNVELRGIDEAVALEGRGYSSGRQIEYPDIWTNDAYLQFMYERLNLMKQLLSENGSIFVHLDYRRAHQIKLIMDEVFGPENFRNEIQVRRTAKHTAMQFDSLKTLQVAFDTILVYALTSATEFNRVFKEASERQKAGSWHGFSDNLYRPTMRYKLFGLRPPSPGGRWLWEKARTERAAENYKLFENALEGNKVSSFDEFAYLNPAMEFVRYNNGSPQYWIPAREEILVDTNWSDILAYSHQSDYPTEKSEMLMQRIIEMASNPGDLVLDCFCGSGTTAVVSQKIRRRWICADFNRGAIHATSVRLLRLCLEQSSSRRGTASPKWIDFAIYEVGDSNDQLTSEVVYKKPTSRVEIRTTGKSACVEIVEFVSPSILEKLIKWKKISDEKGVDFRSMIDCVLIDDDYDGNVFDVSIADVPKSKREFVRCIYEVPLPRKQASIAVKIVDLLGEELIVNSKSQTLTRSIDKAEEA